MGCIITVTMLNRSYDQPKKFVLSSVGEIISSELYFADRVTPVSTFMVKQDIAPTLCDGNYEYVLPEHSVMMIKIKENV